MQLVQEGAQTKAGLTQPLRGPGRGLDSEYQAH